MSFNKHWLDEGEPRRGLSVPEEAWLAAQSQASLYLVAFARTQESHSVGGGVSELLCLGYLANVRELPDTSRPWMRAKTHREQDNASLSPGNFKSRRH